MRAPIRLLVLVGLLVGLVTGAALVAGPAGARDSQAAAASKPAGLYAAWYGHTRALRVHKDLRGSEVIYSGCCEHGLTLGLRFSAPRGNSAKGSIRARVVKVRANPDFYGPGNPAPRKGDVGVYRWRRGEVVSPFSGTNYCGPAAGRRGVCGA